MGSKRRRLAPSFEALARARDAALTRRVDIDPGERVRRDDARLTLLEASGLLDGVGSLAAYVAMPGEPDPRPWYHLAEGRQVALPRIDGDELSFHFVDGRTDVVAATMGILEPVRHRPVELGRLDLVLVPLLVFDAYCHRAGRGRGYYDRALARLETGSVAAARPILLGIADDEDEVAEVAQHDGDVALDAVLTPSRLHRCST